MRAVAPSIILLATVMLAVPARAQTPPAVAPAPTSAAANEKLDSGNKLFQEGKHAAAAARYEEGLAIEAWPQFHYAIAQAHRLGGRCDLALDHYREFLDAKPSEKASEYARLNIERCEQELRDRPPEPDPVPPVTEPDDSKQENVDTRPPPEPRPDLVPEATGPEEERAHPWYSNWTGNLLLAGGLVGTSIGVGFYAHGRKTVADLNDSRDYEDFVAGQAGGSSGRRNQQIGVATASVGLALVAGAVLAYILDDDEAPKQPGAISFRF